MRSLPQKAGTVLCRTITVDGTSLWWYLLAEGVSVSASSTASVSHCVKESHLLFLVVSSPVDLLLPTPIPVPILERCHTKQATV